MTADQWRRRAEAKERNRQNASYERRQQVLAVAKQIRKELREEKEGKAMSDNTRYYLNLIHEHRLRMEGAVENALHKIGTDQGWSREAWPVMLLRADIDAFTKMAAQMQVKMDSLIKQTEAVS